MDRKKTLLSWSSGKDSAWALYKLRQMPDIEIAGIFTSINKKYGRVSLHGVRLEVIESQAQALNLPLYCIELPDPCSNEEYEKIMYSYLTDCYSHDVEFFAFGDLFLEDIKEYRKRQLEGTGISPIFPLWGIPTKKLALEMLETGIEAYITCVDSRRLSPSFSGRKWDMSFMEILPESVDPCGENGEFHTLVTNGPMLDFPIEVEPGETVEREGLYFTDMKLKSNPKSSSGRMSK